MRTPTNIAPRLLAAFVASVAVAADLPQGPSDDVQDQRAAMTAAVQVPDLPLEEWQGTLLDLAFTGVSRLPLDPHIKNRSRAQEHVVQACLELGQLRMAMAYAHQMPTWRRGAAYADIAFHCAERGQREGFDDLVEYAETIAREDPLTELQVWRLHRVLAKLARLHLILGNQEEADRIQLGIVHSEVARVQEVRAQVFDEAEFEAHLTGLDGVVEEGTFDQVKAALTTYSQLYRRFYADEERRAAIEARILENKSKLPRMIGIDLLLELAGHALSHGDRARCLEMVEEGKRILDANSWSVDVHVDNLARLAEMRFAAGQTSTALGELDAAVAIYDASHVRVANIYRAQVLSTLASAYATVGERDTASRVYRRAIEAGVENPNGRPRATNLSETLCSMATHGFRPDAELLARVREIHADLKAPW